MIVSHIWSALLQRAAAIREGAADGGHVPRGSEELNPTKETEEMLIKTL